MGWKTQPGKLSGTYWEENAMFANGELIVVLWHIPVILFILIPMAMLICWSLGLLCRDFIKQLKKSFTRKRKEVEQPIIIDLITQKVI